MTATQTISAKLLPGTTAPALEVNIVGGQLWQLAEQKPTNYTMVVFYRGLHCPLCEAQLAELDRKLSEFSNLGIEIIAISGDTQERAQKSQQDWSLQNLKIGYGLSPKDMRAWGLYISKGALEGEPELFNEPAVFLVKPCGQITLAIVGTTPFGRPHVDDLIGGIDYIMKNNYPVRGTEV